MKAALRQRALELGFDDCRVTRADAPEVDGNAFAAAKKGVRVGDFVQLEITDADAYDLYGIVAQMVFS